MKTIDIIPLKSIVSEFEKPIRSKIGIIYLILKVFELLLIQDSITRYQEDDVSTIQIKILISKMNRIFFLSEKKYFSFSTPFSVTFIEERLHVFEPINSFEITSKTISDLVCLIDCIKDENYDDLFIKIDENNESSILWQVLKELLLSCSGYLRYDFDNINQNGKYHPLHHLDINYSNSSSYKIGLNQPISFNHFIDLLDIETECFYIHF